MKIFGISASHRLSGSSYRLLKEAMNGAIETDQSAETKIAELARLRIDPCKATCAYVKPVTCGKRPFQCNFKDDLQMLFEQMRLADGILIASPRYFIVPSKLQALVERLYCIHYYSRPLHPSVPPPLAGKPFGLLAVSGTGGEYAVLPLLEHLSQFCLYLGMQLVTTGIYPYIGVAAEDPVSEHAQSLEQARVLGKMMVKAAKEKRIV